MLNEEEVARLASDLESFHVERKGPEGRSKQHQKSDIKSLKPAIEEAICAFANDLPGSGKPGFILIGVHDKTGKPTGLVVTDELLRELTSIRSDGNILPFPTIFVYKSTLAGQDIVVVEVLPSLSPPVRADQRVCVRVGPRKGYATRDEERVLSERRRSWDGPYALQQLLRNAVIHRNYETSNAPIQWYWFSDRIEIHNPGGLYGRTTPETFGKTGANDYRNPTIAEALYRLGFVQRFGMGIPIARKACAENGNPPPEFSFGQASFGVIVRPRV